MRILVVLLVSQFMQFQTASAETFSSWTNLATDKVGIQEWSGVATTYDGSIAYASVQGGALYKSVDSGTTWTQIAGTSIRNWVSIATNDSGTIVAAIEASGYIWVSSDSGASWNSRTSTGTKSWSSIAMSASGQIIAATSAESTFQISTNAGTSWTPVTPGASASRAISISGDGTRIALMGNDGIYTSANTGSSWTKNSGFMNYYSTDRNALSMSRDGQKIVAVTSNNSDPKIHFTQNFGSLWETATAQAAATNFISVKVSGDSGTIVIGSFLSASYISYNNGANWSTSAGTGSWSSFASDYSGTRWYSTRNTTTLYSGLSVSTSGFSWTVKTPNDGITKAQLIVTSSDGSKVVVSNYNGAIWASNDGGNTWTQSTGTSSGTSYNCLAMSADGSKVIAGGSSSIVLKSTNGGLSFSQTYSSNATIYGCGMSSDGNVIVFADYSQGIVVSTDGGANYSTKLTNSYNSTTYNYRSVTVASDGSKIAVVPQAANTPVIVSSDTGTTWSITATNASTTAGVAVLKSSGDGSVLIAASQSGGYPKISRDWGSNWSQLPTTLGQTFVNAITISNDGNLILMGQAVNGGSLFQSTDAGLNFSIVSGAGQGTYRSLALTRNKTFLFAGVDGFNLRKSSVVTIQNAAFQSLALSTGSTATFRSQVTLIARLALAGSDGKVTFLANGKKIPGCIKVSTTSLVATCTWKPSARGSVILSATSYPTDGSFVSTTSSIPVGVTGRTGLR
jgi:hypothetical protein